MYDFKTALFRALAHPLRIRILDALRAGPASVGSLREALGAEQAHLSQQLAILRGQDLVQAERRGTAIIYEVRHPEIWTILDAAFVLFENRLRDAQTTLATMQRGT